MIQVQPPFDIKVDFWDRNFALKLITPFDEVYKDKGHEESSRFMWSLWLYEHPSFYNPYRNLDVEQKLEAIRKYVPWFDPEDEFQISCIRMFNHVCLSTIAKGFKDEEDTMIQRQDMIIKLQKKFTALVDEDPLALRDKDTINLMKYHESMRGNTAKLYTQYDEARKLFELEEEELVIHGGGSEDIMESGGLLEIDE